MAQAKTHCYCGGPAEPFMFLCWRCAKRFHSGCLKDRPSFCLPGDTLVKFVCADCHGDAREDYERLNLSWMQVLLLTLYNLQLKGGGKCGYYRWRENICSFIEKHWKSFFDKRKKTSTWHGTVSSTLSTGCPQYFQSGSLALNESGWWALVDPSALDAINAEFVRSALAASIAESENKTVKTSHRRGASKKKRAEMKRSAVKAKESTQTSKHHDNGWMADGAGSKSSSLEWSACDDSTESWFTEKDLKPEATVPQFLLRDDETDLDELEIDPCSYSPIVLPSSPRVEELMDVLSDQTKSKSAARALAFAPQRAVPEAGPEKFSTPEKKDPSTAVARNGDDRSETRQDSEPEDAPPLRKRQKGDSNAPEASPSRKEDAIHLPLSVYEEHALLKKLQCCQRATDSNPEARLLKRRLLVRNTKRERNLSPFDLDREVLKLKGGTCERNKQARFATEFPQLRVLDRFQIELQTLQARAAHHSSFLTRLVGRDEQQMESIVSPYTTRVLKPFIWRDYETVPPKLKLLQEILAHRHRHDPTWEPAPRHPIDYCYVQPKHIPSVNAFCREFFWPGIDLSECLNYPDFSCIVMYKKMVIGFSFMIPDVKCNEAYITFLFTHPEWRKAGIGSFMVYHLIQTCMGKDVTLHVSATNPAIFLYQKFGFKMEEFVLDFYDKYYPVSSTECKHSFFLRLSH